MAANFLQLANVAQSSAFQQRVSYAMNWAAAAIYNEGSGVTNHSARAAYAIKVANGNYSLASTALAVITNSTIATKAVSDGSQDNSIADTDIQNSVNSLWNMLAGV